MQHTCTSLLGYNIDIQYLRQHEQKQIGTRAPVPVKADEICTVLKIKSNKNIFDQVTHIEVK